MRELARRISVSASLVSQVELGKASPSVGTLYAIVNELGLSLDELFFEESAARKQPTRIESIADAGKPLGEIASAAAVGAAGAATAPVQRSLPPGTAPDSVDPAVRPHARKVIQLATGVRWERLTPETPQDVDFLYATYAAGSESCPEDSLMRHSGREYGHVLEGRLGLTIWFDSYELGPGDSVSFESSMPHRLFTIGDKPVVAIWFVVGRRGDPRIVRDH